MRIAHTLSLWLIVLLQLSRLDITQAAKPEEAWKSPQTPFLTGSSKTNLASKSSFGKIRNLQNDNTSLTQANFTIFLNNMQVFGHWFNGISTGPLNYLTQNTGFAWIEAANSDDTDTSDNTPMLDIDLIIFNGEYVDENSLTIRMLSNYTDWEYNQANATMTATNITLPVFQDDSDTSQNCVANVSIFFIDITNNQPFISSADTNDNFGVQFLVISPGCSISIFTGVLTLTDTTSEQLIIYICVMSFAALMGLYSANRLRIGFPVYMEKLKKFSIWSIWLINAWDFYIFLLHVALAVESSAWLMIIALLYFALSIIYQTRLVYAIYFSTQQGSVENVVTGCKFFAAYYCMLYLLDFSYTYYARIEWLLITSSFYLVPQIYHVYQRGKKYKFNFFHVFGFLFSRLFFITYLKLYPDNIYRSSPNLAFVFTYIGFVLIQICILLIQGKWPRFWKTPKPFNYYVQLHTEEEKQEMCAICMEPLGESPFDPAKPMLEKTRTTVVMQTPCNHRYHTSCLQEWMKAKLVCPFDRLDIPSLNNEEVG